jgi:hypothetical protein
MGEYKKNVLALTSRCIPYYPALRKIAKSISGSILFQQLEYLFSIKEGEPFYKFLEPCPDHKDYREGDSFTEVLSFSSSEFRNAFDEIGIRYKSKTAFIEASMAGNPFMEKPYLSYIDKRTGLTWYRRNQTIVQDIIDGLTDSAADNAFSSTVDNETASLGEHQSIDAEMKELDLNSNTKNTSENTQRTTTGQQPNVVVIDNEEEREYTQDKVAEFLPISALSVAESVMIAHPKLSRGKIYHALWVLHWQVQNGYIVDKTWRNVIEGMIRAGILHPPECPTPGQLIEVKHREEERRFVARMKSEQIREIDERLELEFNALPESEKEKWHQVYIQKTGITGQSAVSFGAIGEWKKWKNGEL